MRRTWFRRIATMTVAVAALALGNGAPARANFVGYGCNTADFSYTVDYVPGTSVAALIFRYAMFRPGDRCWMGSTLLTQQTDGNFVLYDTRNGGKRALWAMGTLNPDVFGPGDRWTQYQIDANIVTYQNGGIVEGATHTCCYTDAQMVLQSDGNLVIYHVRSWVPIWATHTNW